MGSEAYAKGGERSAAAEPKASAADSDVGTSTRGFSLPPGYREYYGSGTPLPDGVRGKMERSLGASFADVRTHEGSEAPAIGAAAYTQGSHISFAPGRYDPSSVSGQALLGHELTHVVQQRAGRVAGPQGKDGINGDASLEREADQLGEKAARGEPATVPGAESAPSDAPSGVQRQPIQRRLENHAFGRYWVGPEPRPELETAELIDAQGFEQLSALWRQIEGFHAGQLRIAEADSKNVVHGGFRARMVDSLGKLLSRPHGRRLVTELCAGGQSVLIRPLPAGERNNAAGPEGAGVEAGRRVAGEHGEVAGAKADVVVDINPTMDDDTLQAYDRDFNLIHQPVFLVLGHELIHARHHVLGIATPLMAQPVVDESYHELEEEETIASGNRLDPHALSENLLRGEHRLAARFSHEGYDRALANVVPVKPEQTLAQIAALGARTVSQLLDENPKLAEELLDKDRMRAVPYVASQPVWQQEIAQESDDTLSERLELFDEALKVALDGLGANHALAARVFVGRDVVFEELFPNTPFLMDLMQAAEFDPGPFIGQSSVAALTANPNLLAQAIAHEEGRDRIKSCEASRRALLGDPGIKLRVAVSQKDVGQLAQRAGSARVILNGHPGRDQLPCSVRKVELRGCVMHHVRRVAGHPQTRDEVIREFPTFRNDGTLLGLNPGVDWNALKVGQLLVIPIQPM
jgi:hypothetical protein